MVNQAIDVYFQEIWDRTLQTFIIPAEKNALNELLIPKDKLLLKKESLDVIGNNLQKAKDVKKSLVYLMSKDP